MIIYFEVLRSPFFFIFPEIRKVTFIVDSIIKNVSGIDGCSAQSFCGDTVSKLANKITSKVAKGSLTLAMGKCLWFSVKIKVCQSSLSSP